MKAKRLFFSHDFDAHNDPKIQEMMMDYGAAGYGIYWCIVEMLYQEGGAIPVSSARRIAYLMHVDEECVRRVITAYGLFEVEGDVFFSPSQKERQERMNEVIEKRRKAAYAMHESCKCNASAVQVHSKCTEDKDKEREKEENKENIKEKKKKVEEGEKAAVAAARKRASGPSYDLDFVDDDLRDGFEYWLRYKRDEKKDAYKTQATVEACYKHLLELADGDHEVAKKIVAQSVANGWKGLFPLKDKDVPRDAVSRSTGTSLRPNTDW